jgi:hypothetical protein
MRIHALVVGSLLVACTGQTSAPGTPADAADGEDRPDARPPGPGQPDARPPAPGEPDARVSEAADARVSEAPDFADEMVAPSSAWFSRAAAGGVAAIGTDAAGAGDGKVARLRFAGMAGQGPSDRSSPAFASEIGTEQFFGPGELRARVRLGRCASNEDLVNGIFTYANDGSDQNGNGLADNSEIDIEILCGAPTWILMTSWVDYDTRNGERFKRWSRAVNVATGQIMESPTDDAFGLEVIGTDPALVFPGFPAADAFYEMGFSWSADAVRWFIVIDGVEHELWTLRERQYISTRPVQLLFNLWHPPTHWFAPGGPAAHPLQDSTMEVDWVKYWAAD